MTTSCTTLPARDHPTQSTTILQDDPKAEEGLHHGRLDQQGGDVGQVLSHTLQEREERALYFGRFIEHSEKYHQSAPHMGKNQS